MAAGDDTFTAVKLHFGARNLDITWHQKKKNSPQDLPLSIIGVGYTRENRVRLVANTAFLTTDFTFIVLQHEH